MKRNLNKPLHGTLAHPDDIFPSIYAYDAAHPLPANDIDDDLFLKGSHLENNLLTYWTHYLTDSCMVAIIKCNLITENIFFRRELFHNLGCHLLICGVEGTHRVNLRCAILLTQDHHKLVYRACRAQTANQFPCRVERSRLGNAIVHIPIFKKPPGGLRRLPDASFSLRP
jgi:hypothetical protein